MAEGVGADVEGELLAGGGGERAVGVLADGGGGDRRRRADRGGAGVVGDCGEQEGERADLLAAGVDDDGVGAGDGQGEDVVEAGRPLVNKAPPVELPAGLRTMTSGAGGVKVLPLMWRVSFWPAVAVNVRTAFALTAAPT